MSDIQNCNFDSMPLQQSSDLRLPQLANFNYTNQDFWSIKSRLIQYAQQNFGSSFSDFVESSIAIMLIENMAFLGDTLSFKMDQNANEVYIDSVTEIANAFRIAKGVGFEPTPPIPARAMFSATINSVLSTDLVISTPVSLPVAASSPITYELFPADDLGNPLLENDIIIPAGTYTNTAIVGVEGTTIVETFGGIGTLNQSVSLSSVPVIFDSIRVDIDGVRWEKVDYFTDSQPRREYRIEYDSSYSAFIIFGNNKAGLVPTQGASIQVTYRVGGGVVGNIVSNFVSTQRVFDVSGLNISIPVTFANYTKGEFGYNGDTIDDIRRKLPAYVRTQDRAVTGDDYKTLTDQFATAYNGQVGKSIAVLRNYGCAGNVIDLFVLAKDGDNGLAEATDGLKIELEQMLDEKKMMTDLICIKDGVVLLTDVTIDLVVNKFFKKFKEEINTKVIRRVTDFFSLTNFDFGQEVKDVDVIKSLADIKEISRAEVTFTTNDVDNSGTIVTTKYYEIIRPDTITISFTFE